MTDFELSTDQLDRARGTVVASAAGDALGSQYEFGPPLPSSQPVQFGVGYFGTGVGEWTDDTSMSIPILQALAAGRSLTDPATLAQIAQDWKDWAHTAPDVGTQTSTVLYGFPDGGTEEDARASALAVHEAHGRSGGNGSLMRTGPVALGYLGDGDEGGLVEASGRISQLTHWEDDNVDAVILWGLAIREAILTGNFNMESHVDFLPPERQERWRELIAAALAPEAYPVDFHQTNGWVVSAFQGALSAINQTDSLVGALEAAVRGGKDTDTVAAIAGSLAGARYGYQALPQEWAVQIYGWPELNTDGLIKLVDQAVR